jgi:hypothetical protein
MYKAFKATGVKPRDAGAVLKHFKPLLQQQDKDTEIREHGDSNS